MEVSLHKLLPYKNVIFGLENFAWLLHLDLPCCVKVEFHLRMKQENSRNTTESIAWFHKLSFNWDNEINSLEAYFSAETILSAWFSANVFLLCAFDLVKGWNHD